MRRTFAANELGNATEPTVVRLTTTEEELLDATNEFALGAARFGPAPELDEATDAMEQAVLDLQTKHLDDGQAQQQQALAALVRARKNLRQKLSMSSGASASQCRSFDHQQAQKLRPPKDRKQPPEQQVAEMRKDLDQLAQQQRQWSEDVRQGQGGAELEREPQEQNQPSKSSGQSSQAAQQQQQQQALAEARRLQEQMQHSPASSELAQQRMAEAAEAIQNSLDDMKAGEPEDASETAEAVAEQLAELSEHLAALNAADFAEQLGHAQRLAQRLADEQQSATGRMHAAAQAGGDGDKSGTPAEQQRDIAGGTEMLADILARTSAAAQEQDREIREALEDMKAANPPTAIAQTMNEAAEEYEAGSFAAAAHSAETAHRDIDDLAARLRRARQQYSQPRLEELVSAEQEVADLMEAFTQSESQSWLDSRLSEVERQIETLARRDAQLAKALASAASATGATGQISATAGGAGAASEAERLGVVEGSSFGRSPTIVGRGIRDVAKVLQSRIQEIILASVRMDADEAVPPEYRELVERYYRELSEDIR